MHGYDEFDTSFTGLHHQLVDSSQLSIIVRPHLLWLDVWHVDRAGCLVVLGRVRDEDSQCLKLRILDCV